MILLRIHSLALVAGITQTCTFSHGFNPNADGYVVQRKEFLRGMLLTTTVAVQQPLRGNAEDVLVRRDDGTRDQRTPRDYYKPFSFPNWEGTSLPGPLSLSEACERLIDSEPVLQMGRWPDPILRQPSLTVPSSVFRHKELFNQLRVVARALRNTARKEGALGLAAQQCGIGASLIYIDGVNIGKKIGNWRDDSQIDVVLGGASIGFSPVGEDRFANWPVLSSSQSQREGGGIFLVNPRIIHRSPESDMMVWTEQCLVLPPEFRACLLRDAEVTIEYESLDDIDAGLTKQIKLQGELARCAQHEMDHNGGILIVDHVSLDELLSVNGKPIMADIENADGLHPRRMQRAYAREVVESSLLPRGKKMLSLG